jgi:phosphotransferase system enzyme I (PtsP)
MKIHLISQDAIGAIIELGILVNTPEDIPRVLQLLTDKVAQIMKTDVCSIYFYDADTQTLTLKATHGLNVDLAEKIHMKRGEGLTGLTVQLLKPISVAEAAKSKNFKHIPGLGEEEYTSYLSVPLIYDRQPAGVMVVQNKKNTKFMKKDIQLLLTLAIPVVNIIEKAKFMGVLGSVTATKPSLTSSGASSPQHHETGHNIMLKGIGAAPGISMGKLKIIEHQLARRSAPAQDAQQSASIEKQRLNEAFQYVKAEIHETKKKAEKRLGPDEASIFEAYLLILENDSFQNQIVGEIDKGLSAVKGLDIIISRYMDRMGQGGDEYIKERCYDIQDVARKINDHLLFGTDGPAHDRFAADTDTILLNDFWSVSDFVNLDNPNIKGVISPQGGASSHIAILADALNLPAIFGLGKATSQLQNGDFIIIDGFSGSAIVNPTESTIDVYRREIEDIERRRNLFAKGKDKHVRLIDQKGDFISVGANLGMLAHVSKAVQEGADEVGLYRTEFPFLIRKTLPTEEEQFEIYKRILDLMKGKIVTFRTLDIGADKYVSYLNLPRENNPALGWRSIRFSLERRDLFRIQLRALFRASVYGKMRILFPMINSVEEIEAVRDVVHSVKRELSEENVRFTKLIPLGIMIEVPSAVEMIEHLVRSVQFVSIGTNDLIQYCLAVDRTNPLVAHLYDPFHPAVVKMIWRVVKACEKAHCPLSVCGDMASQPMTAAVLIGMGVKNLSMNPSSIARIKQLVRQLKGKELDTLVHTLLKTPRADALKKYVQDFFMAHDLKDFIANPAPVKPIAD